MRFRLVTLLAAAAVMALCGPHASYAAKKENRLALVFGNGKYRYNTALPNPPNDAKAVANSLRKVGFDVIEAIDADRKRMQDVLVEFRSRLKKADVGMFYYAGHGLQIDGENYLVPVDAQFSRNFDITKQLVSMTRYVEAMLEGPKVNLVFLDACRNNPLAESLKEGVKSGRSVLIGRSDHVKTRSIGQGLAKMKGGIGMLIAYATQPGNVAEDGNGKNSPFTTAVLKHIQEPGLEVRSFLTKVRVGVLNDTNKRQIPWDNSSLVQDFYFIPPVKPQEVFLAPP